MRPPTIPTTLPISRDDTKQIVIMKSLYNSLIEYREPKTHRILIQLFMCLPSRKDFPEYFNIIAKPIAMNKIRERIERQLYPDEEVCMEDFRLMFSNCKFFNEDDSQIYLDAVMLESVLKKKREQLHIEYNRTSRDSKDAVKEAILNTNSATTTNLPNNSQPSTRSERLNNINNNNNNNNTNNTNHVTSTIDNSNEDQSSTSTSTSTPAKRAINNGSTNHSNNIRNSGSTTNHDDTTTTSITNHISTTDNLDRHSPSKTNNIDNGVASNNKDPQANQLINGNVEIETSSIKVNHNHHNETSMDSNSNLSAELIASTPIEKCSLNTRRGRNADAPKRQLLTGYIIYASEIRKQVIDKNPNQNFGDISRLVGNEWKALPNDIRSKYDQRALIHNKRVRERAQRDLLSGDGQRMSNGLHTPKMTKRKLAKLAKEQMRQHHLSISGLYDDSSAHSPRLSQEHSSSMVSQTPNFTYKSSNHQHSQPQTNHQATTSKTTTTESSTQTIAIRFVEPPTKKRLVYSDTFRKYIESLQVPNKDLLAEETTPERPAELPTQWLGAGIGRHESPEAALWALRDFMLQDAVAMRRSMEPYL